MKKELDDALCRDFPNLYRLRKGPRETTCMVYGFQCGDGWEPIIRRLSEKLEAIIVSLPEDERAPYAADQVKEKFGGLRFSLVRLGTSKMEEAILAAEKECEKTCESCGAPGTSRTTNWIRVECALCNATRVNARLLQKTDRSDDV